jgi:transposase
MKLSSDTNGLPIRLALTAGKAHDDRLAGKLLSSGTMLLADRGYDVDCIRALAAKRRAWANIPPRSDRNEPICFSLYLYRAGNLVERANLSKVSLEMLQNVMTVTE